jgi:pilus assembly protein CpaB
MGGRYKYVFWGALVVAALATFGAYRYLQANSAREKVASRTVVVASQDIPEGAAIDRNHVSLATWPAPTIPVGAYSSIDSVVGRVTRINVFTGEALVPGRLAPAGTGPGLELKIPPGQRAMAVRINDIGGVSGLIQPNSRVDVMVTTTDVNSGKQVAKLFMENMRVLSVGTEIQRDPQGRATSATTATLAVTPDEAERLAIAMNAGSIQLVLRGYGDPAAIATRGASTSDVLSQLRGGAAMPTAPTPAPAPAPARRVAPRPAAPPIVIQRAPPPPPPRPDSAIVDVYRGGKSTPQKFDTTIKR